MFECSFIARGDPTHPPLIFLHGLFGCKEDWETLFSFLSHKYYCIAIDLPGHGLSAYREEIIKSFRTFLTDLKEKPILIGYSMGGRIALQLRESVKAVVAIGAHLGLKTELEKEQQRMKENAWKEKLLTLPLDAFLEQWYAQPLFESLAEKPILLKALIQKRSSQDRLVLSQVLSQLRLSSQDLIDFFPTPTLLIHGKKDSKYQQLYHNIELPVCSIENAGHPCFMQNPEQCSIVILNWLENLYADTQ